MTYIPGNQPIQQPNPPSSIPPPLPQKKVSNASVVAQNILSNVSSAPSIQPISSTAPIQRRTLEENKEKLLKEFKEGVFIRTFSDADFEMEKVIQSKLDVESNSNKMEKLYWSSGSVIQENSPYALWEGTGGRCGLVISSDAELGGWNMQDMSTDNPQESWADDRIKDYFPTNYPIIAHEYIQKKLKEYTDPTSQELVRKLLDLDPKVIITPHHFSKAHEYFSARLGKDHPEYVDLLKKLPEEAKSVFTTKMVKKRMRDLAQKMDLSKSYNEAKFRYQPNDILGVFVFNDKASIDKAKILQQKLEAKGIVVPFVRLSSKSCSYYNL